MFVVAALAIIVAFVAMLARSPRRRRSNHADGDASPPTYRHTHDASSATEWGGGADPVNNDHSDGGFHGGGGGSFGGGGASGDWSDAGGDGGDGGH